MKTVEGMREYISLNKVAEKDGVQAVRMSAEISSDPNMEIAYSVAVINHDAYTDHLDFFRKEIDDFYDVAIQRQDMIIGLYDEPDETEETEEVEDSGEPEESDDTEVIEEDSGSEVDEEPTRA